MRAIAAAHQLLLDFYIEDAERLEEDRDVE